METENPAPSFLTRLRAAIKTHNSLVCIGLDPDLSRLPASLPRTVDGIVAFNQAIIAATADLVCAYKPNLAFYESLGTQGLEALERTIRAIPKDVIVIGDAKRGDIGNTAKHYATALFDHLGFDAVTVNPYLGQDSLQPFLEYEDKGIFILCRTSNPGAAAIQNLLVNDGPHSRPLWIHVAELINTWNARANCGLVVGATATDELRRVRHAAPKLPILVPGIGAQGGDLAAAVASHRPTAPTVISTSRAVLYASERADFADAARASAGELRAAINRVREG